VVSETSSVVVTNLATSEEETLEVTENGVAASLFIGNLPTVFGVGRGTDNDGVLTIEAGDEIEVSYFDELTTIGGTATQTDSVIAK